MSGAQEPGLFERIFRQVEKFKDNDVVAEGVVAEGEACLPDRSNC